MTRGLLIARPFPVLLCYTAHRGAGCHSATRTRLEARPGPLKTPRYLDAAFSVCTDSPAQVHKLDRLFVYLEPAALMVDDTFQREGVVHHQCGVVHHQCGRPGTQTHDRVCVLAPGYQRRQRTWHRHNAASSEGLGVLPALQDGNLCAYG